MKDNPISPAAGSARGAGLERVFLALDFATPARALAWLAEHPRAPRRVKVGLELFTSGGPAIIQALNAQERSVFLDLKLHDIPQTVAGAVRAAARLGVEWLTVHAAGGERMLRAAAEAAAEAGGVRPRLLGVTVLTSLDDAALARLDLPGPVPERVVRWARLCREAGLAGVVASAQEAARVRQECGPDFVIVTPGVRPAGTAKNDQARIATPAEALRAGADYLVVGRALTAAPDPDRALAELAAEIENKTAIS